MDRDADRAGLVGDGAGDGLADPPGCVGRELEAAAVVELLDRPHEAEVALLNQVEQGQPRRRVLLGDGHDEAQVGLDEPPLGGPPGLDLLRVVLELLGRQLALGLGDRRIGEVPCLDGLGELDLVDVREQRVLTDLPEVLPHQIFVRRLFLLEVRTGARLVVAVAFSSPHVGCLMVVSSSSVRTRGNSSCSPLATLGRQVAECLSVAAI